VLILVCIVIFIALVFDYVNGMHDAANAIATVVSTRVLTPGQAVMMAAVFDSLSVFLGTHVANSIGTGIVSADSVNEITILAALIGAISWNVLTWWLGLPSSSSHALIGGLVGAGVAHAGLGVLIWKGLFRAVSFIVLSPLIGFFLSFCLMMAVCWVLRDFSPSSVDWFFRKAQIASACLYSLGHGSNDAQKTAGIIALVLYRYRITTHQEAVFHVPWWLALVCTLVIGLGTLSGGWRIVKTMGTKICKFKPVGGFCAETAGAITLLSTALFGIPVSTTHTITGAIIGVGATQRLSAVRWGVAQNIVVAWVMTIPCSAVVSFVTYYAFKPLAHLLGAY